MSLAVVAVAGGFGLGAVGTAFGFGFRHGIDWDHLAAISDLTASEASPRRVVRLASAYVLGHASVVFLLGGLAVVAGAELPSGIDSAMERFVGATLVLLAVYVAWSLARHGRDFRMRSRWTLLLAGVRRLRARRRGRNDALAPVVIEHTHAHAHVDHVHEHLRVEATVGAPIDDVAVGHERGGHVHPHVHVGHLPDDPLRAYGTNAALGIGMLHGIGAETPTQVLLFVAAAGAGGRSAGIALLVAFIVGLVCSNTLIAAVSAFGAFTAASRWWLTVVVSSLTAVGSFAIGLLFLTGHATALPALFTG